MTTAERSERFRRAVNALRSRGELPRATPGRPEAGDLSPANAHAAVTRQMVEDLADDVAGVRSEIRRLVFVVAGAVLLLMIERLIGGS